MRDSDYKEKDMTTLTKEDFMKMLSDALGYIPMRNNSDRSVKRSIEKVYKEIFNEPLSEEQWKQIKYI